MVLKTYSDYLANRVHLSNDLTYAYAGAHHLSHTGSQICLLGLWLYFRIWTSFIYSLVCLGLFLLHSKIRFLIR